jgi:hypothetical protein
VAERDRPVKVRAHAREQQRRRGPEPGGEIVLLAANLVGQLLRDRDDRLA